MNRVWSALVIAGALMGCGQDAGGASTGEEGAAVGAPLADRKGGGEAAASDVITSTPTSAQPVATVVMPSTDPTEPPDGGPPASGEQPTYYTARRDERKCASPYCGGFWVRAVNTDATSCADGTRAVECYVSDLDLSAMKLDDETRRALLERESVFRGRITPSVSADASVASVATFSANEAWLSRAASVTPAVARGSYSRVRASAILCITVPCPSLTEYLLNSTKEQNIHGLDLTYAPGTDKDKAAAQADTNEPQGLLALGANVENASTDSRSEAIVLRATQYFLRVGAVSASTPTRD
jgi:hypothetical protein